MNNANDSSLWNIFANENDLMQLKQLNVGENQSNMQTEQQVWRFSLYQFRNLHKSRRIIFPSHLSRMISYHKGGRMHRFRAQMQSIVTWHR